MAYELLVISVGVLLYGLSMIPGYLLIQWGHGLGLPWVVFTYPTAFYLFIITLILLAGTVKRLCLPPLKPGTYKFNKDKHVFTWFLSRTITEYVLMPFNRVIFTNDLLRYTCLRLFGVKLDYSSGISSSFISDLELLSFGKNCMIGGWAILYGHIEPEPGTVILAPISIGDNTLIGARANITCGSSIGNNTIIGFGVVMGVNCKIGNRCNVGYITHMGHQILIEDDVKVGKYCNLGNGVKIRTGIKLPDYSMVPDFTTIATQDLAETFRSVRISEIQGPGMATQHPPRRPQVFIRSGSSSSSNT